MVRSRMCRLVPLMLVPLGMAIAQEQSSVSPAFSIASFASYNIYGESFSMHSAMSYGGAITMSLTSRIGVEFNAQFGQSQQDFDVIGGTDILGIRTTFYQLQFQYVVLGFDKFIDVVGTAGIGRVRFTTDAYSVSVGTLGRVSVSERTENRNQFTVGVLLTRQLTSRVSLRLGSEVRFITPLSLSQVNTQTSPMNSCFVPVSHVMAMVHRGSLRGNYRQSEGRELCFQERS